MKSLILLTSLLLPYHALCQVVATTVTIPAAVPTSSQYTDADDFRDTSLDIHNYYRSLHNAPSLTWNDSLVDRGDDWADNCEWRHSGGPTGENLAVGYQNVSAAIFAWYDEVRQYDFSDQGFAEETGHFTQMVWRDTTSVGCGRVNCTGQGLEGWYVVCEYWPPGNVIGQFEENVERGSDPDGDVGIVNDPETVTFSSVSATGSATGSGSGSVASATPSASQGDGMGEGTPSRGSLSILWMVLLGISAVVMAGGLS